MLKNIRVIKIVRSSWAAYLSLVDLFQRRKFPLNALLWRAQKKSSGILYPNFINTLKLSVGVSDSDGRLNRFFLSRSMLYSNNITHNSVPTSITSSVSCIFMFCDTPVSLSWCPICFQSLRTDSCRDIKNFFGNIVIVKLPSKARYFLKINWFISYWASISTHSYSIHCLRHDWCF